MNEQTLELLRELSAKLGVSAEHLWSVLVTGAYFDGIWFAVLAGLLFVAMIICSVCALRCDWYQDEPAPQFLVACAASALVFGLMSLYGAAVRLSMPEYSALDYLLRILR